MRDYLNRVPAELTPSERLVKMGLAYLEFAHDHPDHFRLIFNQLNANRNSFNEKVDEASPYHLLLQAVQAVIEAEELTPGENYTLQEIAYSLWSLVHGMAMLRQTHLRYFQADFEAIHRRTLQIFAEGLKNKQLSAV